MIRVILRRLIIPRGNTGSFTLPLLQTAEVGDTVVLSIYDPLYKNVVRQLEGVIDDENRTVTFEFKREDTIDIEPSDRYQWDVTIYHTAASNEDVDRVDSYYAAFAPLPRCEIKEAP